MNKIKFLIIFLIVSLIICFSVSAKFNSNDWIDISESLKGGPATTLYFDSKTDTLYAGLQNKGVYITSDLGESWNLLDNGLNTTNSKLINVIKLDPKNSNVIYLGTQATLSSKEGKWIVKDGFFKSIDGGKSWVESNNGIIPKKTYIAFPPNIYDIEIDLNNNNILYIATREGVFKSEDSGSNWFWSGEGIGGVSVTSIKIDPFDSNILFATSNGLYKSENSGLSWILLELENKSVQTLAISKTNKNLIFTGGGDGIFRSDDGDKIWKDINLMKNDLIPIVRDIEISDIDLSNIYIATNMGIFESNNLGETWIELKPNKLIIGWSSNDITLKDNIIFSATNGFINKSGGLIWMWKKEEIEPFLEIYSPEDNLVTNKINLLINGKTNPERTIKINDNLVEVNKDGTINFNFLLKEGENKIKIISSNGKELIVERNVILDTLSPEIFLSIPGQYYNEYLNIEGYVKDEGISGIKDFSIIINGKKIELSRSLTFRDSILLKEGENKITLMVEDNAGNKTTKIYTIKYIKKITLKLQIGNKFMFVNNNPQEIDVPPTIVEGRTLLPIRWVAEPLGAQVGWDPNEKKVTVSLKDTTIELWIGKNIARVNGVDTPIDPGNPNVVPMIISGRTMLPVRFVAENLGCDVLWDANTRTVTIIYPKE